MSEVTQILNRIDQGEPQAAEQLLPLVYGELRKLAAARMASESPGQTLQPTALVHEAWLRLVGNQAETPFAGRAHFFAAAAEAMRRILVDNARRKRAIRHGGDRQKVDLDEIELTAEAPDEDLLALDEALARFTVRDPAKAELVKLRYFGGFTLEEASSILGISVATAKRHWTFARAWLHADMRR